MANEMIDALVAGSAGSGDGGGQEAAPSKNTTFSLRLKPKEFETLSSLAKFRKVSIAELARQFIREGIREALDPAEINRMIEQEKQRLMQAAEEIRAAVDDDSVHKV